MPEYMLNTDKMFADISDNIAIIINSETGIYYGMNSFATNIYENLINNVSSETILESLKSLIDKRFNDADNLNIKNIKQNFNSFIDYLIQKEIMVEAKNIQNSQLINQNKLDTAQALNINIELAINDNFELIIKEYNDAQELLLADPIHEVKEETGWTPEKSSLNTNPQDIKRRKSKFERENN